MAVLHSNESEFYGELALASRLQALPDPRLHLWFGLSYLPNCPDIDSLFWHEQAGVFVVEIKAVTLDMVEAYGLKTWKCRGRKEAKSPPRQAYDAMMAFRGYLANQLQWLPFLIGTVCW